MALTWFHYFQLNVSDLDEDISCTIGQYLQNNDYIIQKLPFADQTNVSLIKESPLNVFGAQNYNSDFSSFKQDFYSLRVPHSNIIIVDDFKMFMHATDLLITKKDVRLVGLDCEWKPGFERSTNQVALLQLATSDFVYLFDLTVIESKVDKDCLKTFFKRIFTTRRITKLGFGFASDLNALASYSFFAECLQGDYIRNLVDICELVTKIEASNPSFFPYSVRDLPVNHSQVI